MTVISEDLHYCMMASSWIKYVSISALMLVYLQMQRELVEHPVAYQ